LNSKEEFNLKYHMNGISVAFSIIFISYIDKYVYDFRTLIGAISAGIIAYVLTALFKKLSVLDKEISKRTDRILTALALFLIFFSFYFFQL
jgi:ABC-type Co2+ transport system permease subunit